MFDRSLKMQVLEDRRMLAEAVGVSFFADSPAPETTVLVSHADASPASAESTGAEGAHSTHQSEDYLQETIQTHHDAIPNFAFAPTIIVSESGRWSEIPSLAAAGEDDIIRIAEGASIVFDSSDAEVKAIGIVGELRFDPSARTALTLQDLIVYRDGYLEIGTPESPVVGGATITFADKALDLDSDPSQYGNGMFVFGKLRVSGTAVEAPFVRLGSSLGFGESVLSLAGDPAGWSVGDRIAVPATTWAKGASQWETFTIKSISGREVSLETPAHFSHQGALDGDLVTPAKSASGEVLHAHAANLTRTVVIRSENPAGVRGHFLATGRADIDIRYASFQDLGRTSIADLDSTRFNDDGTLAHTGANQVGRYSVHIHHVYGPTSAPAADPAVDRPGLPTPQLRLVGNVVEGGLKWGYTIHDTHYGLIKDNISVGVEGAGFVTEDGSESYNVFEGNLAIGSPGSGAKERFDTEGRRGAGFWLRGNHNYFFNNVAAGATEGFGFYIRNGPFDGPTSGSWRVPIPLHPGADMADDAQRQVRAIHSLPLLGFEGNEVYAADQNGLGMWGLQGLPAELEPVFKDTTIWNVNGRAIFLDYSTGLFDGLVIRGNPDNPGTGIQGHNDNGRTPLTVRNFDFQLLAQAYSDDNRPAMEATFEQGFARNYGAFRFGSELAGFGGMRYVVRDVKFDAVPGHELAAIEADWSEYWLQGGNYVQYANHPVQILVYDFQGDPDDDFRVWYHEQHPDYVTNVSLGLNNLPRTKPLTIGGVDRSILHTYSVSIFPTPGLTNQESWDRHRIALGSEVAPASATAARPGVDGLVEPLNNEEFPEFVDLVIPAFYFASNRDTNLPTTVELVYATNPDARMQFRIDGGEWIEDGDNDGVFEFSSVAPGKHRIESVYAAGEHQWGRVVTHTFTVADEIPLNRLPTIDPLPSEVLLAENAGAQSLPLSGISAGADETQSLRVSATSSNTELIPHPTVSYTSPASTAALSYVPIPGESGTARITVTVQDAGPDGVFATSDDGHSSRAFDVVVQPTAISPTLDPILAPTSLSADAGLQSVPLTGISAGEGEDLRVSVTSDQAEFFTRLDAAYLSPGSTGTLLILPDPEQVGVATITVSVSTTGPDGFFDTDDDGLVSQSFQIEIERRNAAPTLDPIQAPVKLTSGAGLQAIPLTGISAGSGESQELIVSVTSDDPSLFARLEVDYRSPESSGLLYLRPDPSRGGEVVVTVRVQDAGSDGLFDTDDDARSEQSFDLALSPSEKASGPQLLLIADRDSTPGIDIIIADDQPEGSETPFGITTHNDQSIGLGAIAHHSPSLDATASYRLGGDFYVHASAAATNSTDAWQIVASVTDVALLESKRYLRYNWFSLFSGVDSAVGREVIDFDNQPLAGAKSLDEVSGDLVFDIGPSSPTGGSVSLPVPNDTGRVSITKYFELLPSATSAQSFLISRSRLVATSFPRSVLPSLPKVDAGALQSSVAELEKSRGGEAEEMAMVRRDEFESVLGRSATAPKILAPSATSREGAFADFGGADDIDGASALEWELPQNLEEGDPWDHVGERNRIG